MGVLVSFANSNSENMFYMVQSSRKPKLFISILLTCIGMNTYGQISVREDFKKQLWKEIKPEISNELQKQPLKMKEIPLDDNKYIDAYENYKYKEGGRLLKRLKNEYNVSPNLTQYKGVVPLNQLPAGSTRSVYMGGHFYNVSNAGTRVTPSGIDLSFSKKKKLSEKSKSILRNVFGMEIED